VLIPPYRGAGYQFEPDREPYYRRAIELMEQSGELEGWTVDVDPGVHTDHKAASRDEALYDYMAVAVQERVRAITEQGDHDAIVVLGAIDVAFHSSRLIAQVPITNTLHSAVHMASLLSDRFSLIDVTDPQAARMRRLVREYGLGDKLASVRWVERTSTAIGPALAASVSSGSLTPEVEEVLDRIVDQGRLCADLDRAELLIIGYAPLQAVRQELRERLDAVGLADLPLVWGLSSAVAVARSLVAMGLMPSRRTYPNDDLVAKPSFR
jgi:allantoin racemase